ncbi:MAG: energy-coupling factor transporter transmembrane protein EcfT [Deltaproteobacteria bacterium]|nr:energy-coupling factor transporter transmembrane protein EcfT [Deltaproteobacteria bacterium]
MRVNLYIDRDTFLHRLHPQVKLGILAATFASIYAIDRPLLVAPAPVALGLLLFAAGAAGNARRFAPMLLAVPVATFTMWSLFYGYGANAAAAPPRSEAMEFAAAMALKLESFVLSSLLCLSITRVEEFTEALRGLGVPYRVSFTVAMAFRLVPLFLGSALSVVTAQRARGLDFSRGSVLARLRRYVPVIVPVFMGALRRADAMAMALEARGFGRRTRRASFVRSRLAPRDLVVGAALAAVVLAYLSAWALGYGRLGGGR